MSEAEVVAFLAELRRVFDRVAAFPVPTIAAIDGPALGGGLELALACDFRVADSRVQKLGFPEVQLGIIPGAGGTQRAPRLLGPTKAKELIYTGRLIDAKLALDWGLLDYVSEKDQTGTERALELAKGMARSGEHAWCTKHRTSLTLTLQHPWHWHPPRPPSIAGRTSSWRRRCSGSRPATKSCCRRRTGERR
jgi:enoyl-CoA hydratase/carnithine racemase